MGLRTGLPASLIRLTLIEHLLYVHPQALPLLCWGRHRVKNKRNWGDKMDTGLQLAQAGSAGGRCHPREEGPLGPPWRARGLRCVSHRSRAHSFHELRRSVCSVPQTPPGVRTLSGEPRAAPTIKGETEGHGGHRKPLTQSRGCQPRWKLTLEV